MRRKAKDILFIKKEIIEFKTRFNNKHYNIC